MKTIQERYEEIKDRTDLTDSIDKLIVDCYRYKVFQANPSAKFKREFKDDFEYDYPILVSDLKRQLASDLRGRVKFLKEDEAFEEKMKAQRAKRGYADVDVWNMDSWFLRTMLPMMKQLRKKHHGFPGSFLSGFDAPPEESEAANAKWERILDRMIFLLTEMDADKCSMKNPYEKAYNGLNRKFRKELGWFGEKAKTPEELAEEKEKGSSRMYSPWDFPDRYPTAKEIKDKYFDYEAKIDEYRDKCKDEFFELFSKYFWMLWD